jgi:hypothetical protein
MSELPQPRGELSEALLGQLHRPADTANWPDADADPLSKDAQLALYVAYELHYRSFDGVDQEWEWEPSLLGFRADLERGFEEAVRDATGTIDPVEPEQVGLALAEMARAEDGPSLSRFIAAEADLDQVREFLIHRSAYQLKEADPHSWAIPRLSGPPKAALVEIQADEYGGGAAERVHATLFAKSMESLGLDPTYGAYLDRIPAVTLATVNLMSLFGLHRRLRGATVGHLAGFELTSAVPNRRYATGLRRLGADEDALDFFDEHVEADSVHENIAAYDMAQGLAVAEPELARDVIFGAKALLAFDERFAEHLLSSWERGEPSLSAHFSSPGAQIP